MWFLGIDIGTTHVKAVGVTEDGQVLPAARAYTPTVTAGGLPHHDPDAVWAAVAGLVRGYAKETAAPHGQLGGLSAASFGQEESIAVDAAGRPARPSLAWWVNRPRRALDADTAAWLDSPGHYAVSGIRSRPMQTPEEVAQMRIEAPDAWRRTRKWVDYATYVLFRLTGQWAASTSQLTHSQCFELATLEPHAETMEAVGVTPDLFAPPLEPGSPLGEVRATALDGVALAPGAVATMGGHDQVMAAYAHAAAPGSGVLDSIGTSEYLMSLSGPLRPGTTGYQLEVDIERAWRPDEFLLGCGVPTGKALQVLADRYYAGQFDPLFAALAQDREDQGQERPGGPGPGLAAGPVDLSPEGLLALARLPPGSPPDDIVRACTDALARIAHARASALCELSGTAFSEVILLGSLFRHAELVAQRTRIWPEPTRVSGIAEAVATGAALMARERTGSYR
jgi:sugar (pentulose or hexulose) kinase